MEKNETDLTYFSYRLVLCLRFPDELKKMHIDFNFPISGFNFFPMAPPRVLVIYNELYEVATRRVKYASRKDHIGTECSLKIHLPRFFALRKFQSEQSPL